MEVKQFVKWIAVIFKHLEKPLTQFRRPWTCCVLFLLVLFETLKDICLHMTASWSLDSITVDIVWTIHIRNISLLLLGFFIWSQLKIYTSLLWDWSYRTQVMSTCTYMTILGLKIIQFWKYLFIIEIGFLNRGSKCFITVGHATLVCWVKTTLFRAELKSCVPGLYPLNFNGVIVLS